MGHEIFIRSPSLKVDDEHVNPHSFGAMDSFPSPSSQRDFNVIEDALSKNSVFSQLRCKERKNEFFSKFRKQVFQAGETITPEGYLSDSFYIIDEGAVELNITRGRNKHRHVGILGPGQSFGRLGISHREPVFASMKAKTNVSIWVVDGPTFHRYAETTRGNSQIRDKKQHDTLLELIKGQQIFQHLSPEKIANLSNFFFRIPTKPDNLLTRQGFMGDYYFLVQEGEFEVYVARPGKIPKLVDTVRPGGSFGSLSLLYDNPRAATVKSKNEGVVWAIDRHTFREFVEPGPTYLQEAFDKYASVHVGNERFMTPQDFLQALRSQVSASFIAA